MKQGLNVSFDGKFAKELYKQFYRTKTKIESKMIISGGPGVPDGPKRPEKRKEEEELRKNQKLLRENGRTLNRNKSHLSNMVTLLRKLISKIELIAKGPKRLKEDIKEPPQIQRQTTISDLKTTIKELKKLRQTKSIGDPGIPGINRRIKETETQIKSAEAVGTGVVGGGTAGGGFKQFSIKSALLAGAILGGITKIVLNTDFIKKSLESIGKMINYVLAPLMPFLLGVLKPIFLFIHFGIAKMVDVLTFGKGGIWSSLTSSFEDAIEAAKHYLNPPERKFTYGETHPDTKWIDEERLPDIIIPPKIQKPEQPMSSSIPEEKRNQKDFYDTIQKLKNVETERKNQEKRKEFVSVIQPDERPNVGLTTAEKVLRTSGGVSTAIASAIAGAKLAYAVTPGPPIAKLGAGAVGGIVSGIGGFAYGTGVFDKELEGLKTDAKKTATAVQDILNGDVQTSTEKYGYFFTKMVTTSQKLIDLMNLADKKVEELKVPVVHGPTPPPNNSSSRSSSGGSGKLSAISRNPDPVIAAFEDKNKMSTNLTREKIDTMNNSPLFKGFMNDGIITPKGEIIKHNPLDYLIAMKDPSKLNQSANSNTYNITINTNGGSDRNMVDEIIRKLKFEINRRGV